MLQVRMATRRSLTRALVVGALAALCYALVAVAAADAATPKVLLFTKTTGAPLDSVAPGTAAIQEIGAANGFDVEVSSDAAKFTTAELSAYRAVVFLQNSGDVLTPEQEDALQSYIEDGGGFAGIHDAARAQPTSTWFGNLIGARMAEAQPTAAQSAVIEVPDRVHPATKGLPIEWQRTDLLPNWRLNPSGQVHTLAIARERSYTPGAGANGWNHPISWCRDFDGGRSFYTGMGRTSASYAEADFRKHLRGGLLWAAGLVRGNCKATIASNYKAERLTKANSLQGSSPSRLDQIGEAHGIAIADNGLTFYIGRADRGAGLNDVSGDNAWGQQNAYRGFGTIHVWDPADKSVALAGSLDVFGDSGSGSEFTKKEDGLVGIALDPDFTTNHYLYTHWTPYQKVNQTTHVATRRISRFTYDPDTKTIVDGSEKVLLEWEYQAHRCCHMGGDMTFDEAGNLYVATGDTNSSEEAGGYGALNAVPSFDPDGPNGPLQPYRTNDARGTAGNTNNLNGKILRIKPLANPGDPGLGTAYEVPGDNLFTGSNAVPGKTRPEIYVMGVRNPTRLWVDPETNWLVTGWVGPDAGNPSAEFGPAKYENYAAIEKAGNYGWPFCMGNLQPYRKRNDATGAAFGLVDDPSAWYDCKNIKNTSPWNTGLEDLPPVTPTNIWYSPQGGGPVHPLKANGLPDYGAPPVVTQPYLRGGSQATMSGPIYRYDAASPSTEKWPEYWDGKWMLGDHYAGNGRVAVTLDTDTVNNHKPPKSVTDIAPFVTNNTTGNIMGWRFGPDGALYVLNYGSNFFTVNDTTALWRYSYTGGASTPMSAPTWRQGNEAREVLLSSSHSGGVEYEWDFGDGSATSTDANPEHVYAEAKPYEVTLKVTYADGETDTQRLTVTPSDTPDDVPPTSTASLNPEQPGPGGTYEGGEVMITLASSDSAGGSGIDKIQYRIDGGPLTQYSAPFSIKAPGAHRITYRAWDKAGNREAYKAVGFTIVKPDPCRNPVTDEFDGTTLNPRWQVLRRDDTGLKVENGALNLTIRAGDMIGGTADARNVLLQGMPDGAWTITTKLNISKLTQSGQQAGIILWEGENPNSFAKILFINKGSGTRWFEYVLTKDGGTVRLPNTGAVSNIPNDVYIRATRDETGTIRAQFSLNGTTWSAIGPPITELGPEISGGLKVSAGSSDNNAVVAFDWFRTEAAICTPQGRAAVTPAAPDGKLNWYATAPTVTLDAVFQRPAEAQLQYRLDGAQDWIDYTAPVKLEKAGERVMEYRAFDRNDPANVGAVRTLRLKVDADAPTTTATTSGNAATGPVRVGLSAQDGSGAGVEKIEYRVDGGSWTTTSRAKRILDGTAASFEKWRQAPDGEFVLQPDGSIRSKGGLGMLWYPVKQFADFSLKFQFRDARTDTGFSNGGAFVRFPDPRTPNAMRDEWACNKSLAMTSQAWVAVQCGHEIQIYDGPTDETQKTGSIYNFQPLTLAQAGAGKKGDWNDYEIRVVGQKYTVIRNGKVLNEFDNGIDKNSSRTSFEDPPTQARRFAEGFIGLQNHGDSDLVEYRDVSVTDLAEDTAETATVSGVGTHVVEYRSTDAAGNVEAVKSTTVTIGSPVTPSGGTRAPAVSYKLGLDGLGRPSWAAFRKKGLWVDVACGAPGKGLVKLSVSGKTARKLKLRGKNRTVLGSKTVACGKAGATPSVRVKVGRKQARALAKAHVKSVKVTVSVRVGKETDRSTLTIRRK